MSIEEQIICSKSNADNETEPHRKILQAIRERNIELGEKEMINHLNISLQDILEVAKNR